MDYATFKSYITDLSWRTNDTALASNLDNLIVSAHSELNNIFRAPERLVDADVSVTTLDHTLPTDYYSMVQVYGTDLNRGEFLYVSEGELRNFRETSKNQHWHPVYSLIDKTLLLCGPVDGQAGTPFNLTYKTTMPDFATTDTSWLADTYLNIYEAAVMKRIAIWSREDERIQFYTSLLRDEVAAANENAAWDRASGRRADQPLPRPASASHRFTQPRVRRGYKVRGYR